MPRIGVHAIITNAEARVFLVKKNYLSRDWGPPGGMMEDGESIPSAVAREVLEETGLVVVVMELIALGSRPQTNDVIVVVSCEVLGSASVKVDPEEIADSGFFSIDDLPKPMKPEVQKLLTLFQSGARGQLLVI